MRVYLELRPFALAKLQPANTKHETVLFRLTLRESMAIRLQKVVIRELFVDVMPLVPLFASCDRETQFEICK